MKGGDTHVSSCAELIIKGHCEWVPGCSKFKSGKQVNAKLSFRWQMLCRVHRVWVNQSIKSQSENVDSRSKLPQDPWGVDVCWDLELRPTSLLVISYASVFGDSTCPSFALSCSWASMLIGSAQILLSIFIYLRYDSLRCRGAFYLSSYEWAAHIAQVCANFENFETVQSFTWAEVGPKNAPLPCMNLLPATTREEGWKVICNGRLEE